MEVRKLGLTGFQGYQFHLKLMEQLRMLALKSKISSWFPELFWFYLGVFQVSSWQLCSYNLAV